MRLAVSVEGRTEEEFVKRVLSRHLRTHGIEAKPVILGRARGRGRGGNVSAERLAREMADLSGSFGAVTSLVDYYGFRDQGRKTVGELEEELRSRIGRLRGRRGAGRILPYVQRHEFEGLLFSDVSEFGYPATFPDGCVAALRTVRARFRSPEDIDDGVRTAPSKRIAEVIPNYDKVLYGPMLAGRIGLDRIRAECRRFDAWVTDLEALGSE